MLKPEHHDGEAPADILLYTLSTCGWCRKTKAFLNELGVAYDYIDVDLPEGEDAQEATKEIVKLNPSCSFPTLVVNQTQCIIGFQEDKIREVIGK